jgi:hypothetical protein
MALTDLNIDPVTGLLIGAGALIVGPMLVGLGRPVAKMVMKGGILAFDAAAEVVSSTRETITDIVSEAQVEIATERLRPGRTKTAAD